MKSELIRDRSILDEFVKSSPSVHYMKTSMWGEFRRQTAKETYEMLGFYEEDGTLRATAMVLLGSFMGHSYAYVPWGPAMDYTDESLRKEVFTLLKQYAEQKQVTFLRTDPNVVRCHHQIDGPVIDDGFSNEAVTEELKQLGYRHKGYGYAYNGSWTNRFTLITDLSGSMDEIVSHYAKARKTSLNRHRIIGVSTRIGSEADLHALMEFEAMLAEQDGFKPHPKKFFQALLESFGKHAVLYVTDINLRQMVQGIETELESGKYDKDPEAKASKEKQLAHAGDLLSEYGASVPIACGLFIRYGRMSWDLYTYNHKEFSFVQPVDNLHRFAMEDMKSHGVTRYDMCGFSGVTTKDDPEYGLYAYKKSFGPEFIEQIGEFDYPVKAKGYESFLRQKDFEVRARHKWWKIAYRRK